MSSHHFVKEGQEPALLIFDALSLALAEPLLEWAPLVIVADTVLTTVLSWGIKVDVALVQEDLIEEMKAELIDQFPVEIATYHHQIEVLSTALNFLVNRKQSAVNIIAETSDSLFDEINRFTESIQVDVFNRDTKWVCVPSGQYQKWLPEKSRLKIIVREKQDLIPTGLHLQEEYWECEKDGIAMLRSNTAFWVGESY